MVPERTGPESPPSSQPDNLPTDRLIVKLKSGANAALLSGPTVTALSRSAGVALNYVRPMSGDAHVMALPGKVDVATAWATAKKLMEDPTVDYAEPDARMQPMMVPNDPSFSSQWHYQAPGVSPGGINLPAAWDITTGSAGITVAVVDTGLRPHADIDSNILDGSGRVVPGYDFIADSATANDGGGRDADPTDPGDWCSSSGLNSSWHGTHVTGTIGALSNNGAGVTGINWTSKLLPVRVLGTCGGYNSDVVDGMRWAAGLTVTGVPANPNPARVMNLSLGGSGACSTTFQNAINDIVAANAIVVVAAGNSSDDVANHQPANCNNVIPVAAVGPTGARAYYSSYGSRVAIAAPGGDMSSATTGGVLSTLNTGTTTPGADSYAYYQGTSMATPHVTGVVSLMLSVNPTLTPADVLTLLRLTARAFPTGTVRDCTTAVCGAGIVDAAAAVTASATSAGLVLFDAASQIVNETSGAATITVRRVAGSAGPASVNFTTAAGTATAGVDYTPVSGTLNWANGDQAAKTITIPIANDGIPEGPETFTVTLSGATGATLGSPSTATVTITDPEVFPPNGTIPTGWTVPATANSGWSVASDAASEGVLSLKSNPIGNSQKAQIEVTTEFESGVISFARRVSSEWSWDYLYVYVDGVSKYSSSGEQPWATVTIPITAGTHTIRWSYEKDSSYSAGSDAVWIDSVVLPTVNPSAPGILQFSTPTAIASESAGIATVAVTRTAGSFGAASVNYATASGSALAGADFTATSGTLTWADGERGTKTISIPITNDSIAERPENFFVNLFGASGASLGGTTQAVVSIVDPEAFPPNAAVPAGWTKPSTANAGWSVAIDQAWEGDVSLKSDSLGAYQVAQIEVTASFEAGIISFARRVSSQSYSTLYFFIDGVRQQSWSGTQPWATFSIPVSAGTHTLRWSYETGGGTSTSSDAAWIDAVSLPIFNAASPGTLQFTSPEAFVSESAGSVALSVARMGGSNGAASVSFATVGGTATEGSDFAAVSGSLSWADGDHSVKTISIPITNDGVREGAEKFYVTLTGASGAGLGLYPTAVVSIVDPESFPASGAIPAGWTVPSGANTGWSVAMDQAYEGMLSLKSNTLATGQKAQIEFTAVFEAGTISFARRTASGYSSALRFYIDGVQQQSWSGTQTWAVVTFPISAGTHTLRWSYDADTYYVISGDAAWIDAVSLPVFDATTPGVLQFTSPTAFASESAGSVTLSVARMGGSSGAASIDYATVSGTAIAGSDFTATSGTLNWAADDHAPKTITIPITNDGIGESPESFFVALTNASGAGLGNPALSTVTIVDPEAFPRTGGIPAGWTVPSGANTGWSVAMDQAYEGMLSLKSNTLATGQKAQIEFTTVFEAGTISFALRTVLGYSYSYSALRFYIDGVQQGAWSGTQAWAVVTFPISAGTHTLRWSYDADTYYSISGDAAWIDAVSLPVYDPTAPGVVQFTNSTAIAMESAGAIAVSVERAYGSAGAASVNYSTANGTAIAGSDFAAVSGTLYWADGDHAPKTITIPIANDGVTEAPELFYLNLANASGATLGSRNSIAITILDPEAFPPNGTMPSGWMVPATANAGWSVAMDQASEGAMSLKSNPILDGQKAQIEVTSLFQAGTISFARRVSSQANYDLLRFYIDGVAMGSWSGEQAWAAVSYTIPSGPHTLRWSYEKDASCCKAGSDAAWIDAVVLPYATVPSAPMMNGVTPGRGNATISFTAPSSDGGSAIVGYTAACMAAAQPTRYGSSLGSSITVKGLVGGVTYSCLVAAQNGIGFGPWSPASSVLPAPSPSILPLILMILE